MAAFDYAKTRATATRLIERFGQAVTFHRVSAETGDAWNPTQQTTSYPARAAVLGYEDSEIDGTMVQAGDRKLYVSVFGIEPTTSDKVVIGTESLRVVNVKPLNPAGTVVFFEVQCRA